LHDKYFEWLKLSAGFIVAHVTWTCRQSNAGVEVTGFQVMVNDKKYGTVINSDVFSLRIKVLSSALTK